MPLYPNPHSPDSPWYAIAERWGSPNLKWCEVTLNAWISEPANTWSNLLFFYVAYKIKTIARHSPNQALQMFPLIIFLMGLASFIYHASNTYPTQIIDFIGMFGMLFWCFGNQMMRLGKLRLKNLARFIWAFTFIFTGILHLMYLSEIKFQSLILGGGFVIVMSELLLTKKAKTNYKYLFISIGFLIIAFSSSVMDHTRVFCIPDQHFIHGHALWHVASAIGMYFIAKYYSQFKITN